MELPLDVTGETNEDTDSQNGRKRVHKPTSRLLESQQQQRREFDDGTNGTDLTACTVPKKRTRQDKDNPPAKKTAGREKDNRKMPVKSKPLGKSNVKQQEQAEVASAAHAALMMQAAFKKSFSGQGDVHFIGMGNDRTNEIDNNNRNSHDDGSSTRKNNNHDGSSININSDSDEEDNDSSSRGNNKMQQQNQQQQQQHNSKSSSSNNSNSRLNNNKGRVNSITNGNSKSNTKFNKSSSTVTKSSSGVNKICSGVNKSCNNNSRCNDKSSSNNSSCRLNNSYCSNKSYNISGHQELQQTQHQEKSFYAELSDPYLFSDSFSSVEDDSLGSSISDMGTALANALNVANELDDSGIGLGDTDEAGAALQSHNDQESDEPDYNTLWEENERLREEVTSLKEQLSAFSSQPGITNINTTRRVASQFFLVSPE